MKIDLGIFMLLLQINHFVSRHAVLYSRMCTGMGQNCEHLRDAVTSAKERKLEDDKEMV